ncbi:hypothetical protein CDAR_239731 [Caerostris darwini]|uniref:Uncharacterized protein n=1 Tax=Caerostris darwini TaxID=1538125 RepID=A0AAV4R2S2_9ARAC|nr:hypothetical protein CDAR_239731 [Caerostris darwini]
MCGKNGRKSSISPPPPSILSLNKIPSSCNARADEDVDREPPARARLLRRQPMRVGGLKTRDAEIFLFLSATPPSLLVPPPPTAPSFLSELSPGLNWGKISNTESSLSKIAEIEWNWDG